MRNFQTVRAVQTSHLSRPNVAALHFFKSKEKPLANAGLWLDKLRANGGGVTGEEGFTPVRRSAEHGFTLVELMVVIVIIGLLATIVAINVIPATDTARVEKAKADIATIEQALEQYRLDNLTYPSATDGLAALLSPPAALAQPQRYRRGGYIKKLPDDPWGRAYGYAVPGKKGAFDISSLGADGQPGGENENADIHSSEL